MSRIDYITVALVALCLGALIFLLLKVARIDEKADIPSVRPAIEVPTGGIDSLPAADTAVPRRSDSVALSPPKAAVPVPDATKRYLVVAASFPEEALAQRELDRLVNLGYEDCEIGYFNQRKIVSVIAGRFADYERASAVAEKMNQAHQLKAYVHEKRVQ
jgi:hypothetical protein